MAELRGLGDVYKALTDRGGKLFAISVDPPSDAKRVVKQNDLPFDVLCDTEREVTGSFGLLHEDGKGESDIPIPAHVLIDRNGSILWKYTASLIQDRPDPAEALEACSTRTRPRHLLTHHWKPTLAQEIYDCR